MTLIELLVATVATLLLVLAVTQAFAVVSEIIAANRAAVEMAGQLRSTSLSLERDLDRRTVTVEPWIDSVTAEGYFEYIERPRSQLGQLVELPGFDHIGDVDDILMFTARTSAEPFVGLYAGGTVQSDVAEIVWWTNIRTPWINDPSVSPIEPITTTTTLHRRVLLVKPELNVDGQLPGFGGPITPARFREIYYQNDISIRPIFGQNGVIQGIAANSLSDLSFRANRFAHYPIPGPGGAAPHFRYEINLNPMSHHSLFALTRLGNFQGLDQLSPAALERVGYDTILPNVLSFDVQAYDVRAPLVAHRGFDGEWGIAGVDDDQNSNVDDINEAGWPGSDDESLVPGDPGWIYNPAIVLGQGTYVDLNYRRYYPAQTLPIGLSQFSDVPDPLSGLGFATYDTWPFDFERNGFNDDSALDGLVDEGINGLDDEPYQFGVDDMTERETRPPYSTRLRGIQVRIRVLDPDSRQIRQQTVRADFTVE